MSYAITLRLATTHLYTRRSNLSALNSTALFYPVIALYRKILLQSVYFIYSQITTAQMYF